MPIIAFFWKPQYNFSAEILQVKVKEKFILSFLFKIFQAGFPYSWISNEEAADRIFDESVLFIL